MKRVERRLKIDFGDLASGTHGKAANEASPSDVPFDPNDHRRARTNHSTRSSVVGLSFIVTFYARTRSVPDYAAPYQPP